jgi:hypothetical protein
MQMPMAYGMMAVAKVELSWERPKKMSGGRGPLAMFSGTLLLSSD